VRVENRHNVLHYDVGRRNEYRIWDGRDHCWGRIGEFSVSPWPDRGFPEWHHLPQILRFRKIPV